MDRFLQLGLVAAQEAVRDAQLDRHAPRAERVGVLIGSGIGGIGTIVDAAITLHTRGPDRVSPFVMPMMLPDMLSGLISIDTGAKGPNFAISSACATAGHSLGEAAEIIRRGDAEVMIAGGAEAPDHAHRPGGVRFDARAVAPQRRAAASEPPVRPRTRRLRAGRGGRGRGAGEPRARPGARRAHLRARWSGYGATGDAYHITAPSEGGEGAARAMRLALEQGGSGPERHRLHQRPRHVDAAQRPHRDRRRSRRSSATHPPPVSSTKSMTGHLIGASGAVEAIVCIKAILEGCLPPTINYENPDPECDLDYVPNTARAARVDAALSNSLGFGGHNTALIVRRFERERLDGLARGGAAGGDRGASQRRHPFRAGHGDFLVRVRRAPAVGAGAASRSRPIDDEAGLYRVVAPFTGVFYRSPTPVGARRTSSKATGLPPRLSSGSSRR